MGWGTILYYQNIVFFILLWNASALQNTFQWLHLSLTACYLNFKHNLCFFLCSNANFLFFLHAANIRCVAACLHWWVAVPHLKVVRILMAASQTAEPPIIATFCSCSPWLHNKNNSNNFKCKLLVLMVVHYYIFLDFRNAFWQ